MDVLDEFLNEREKAAQFPPLTGPDEARLLKFDDWLWSKLWTRIDWRWAGDEVAQRRRCNQARNYMERMVVALWRRGWLLDGKELAKHILAPISTIAEYQGRGAIKEFWPYFCATVDRYVGVNSEEIQVEARRVGATMDGLVSKLGLKQAQKPPSLPELIAQRAIEVAQAQQLSLREKQAALRAKERERANDLQMPLL